MGLLRKYPEFREVVVDGPISAASAEDFIAKQQAQHRQALVGIKPAVFEWTVGLSADIIINKVWPRSSRLVEIHLEGGEMIVVSPIPNPAGKNMRMNLARSFAEYQGPATVKVRENGLEFRLAGGVRVIHWEIQNDSYLGYAPIRVEHLKSTTKPKVKIVKELNTAALIRKDTVTVKVGFPIKGQQPEGGYTYVTCLKLDEGDTVVCDSKVGFAIGTVLEVHKSVMVDPESDMKLSWIVQKIDTAAWAALQVENQAIDDAVAAHYRTNLQKGYRHRILGEMDADALALLPAAARD